MLDSVLRKKFQLEQEEDDLHFVVTAHMAGLVLQRKLELEQDAGGWEAQEKMFLVCVYNVSPDQPYTVFKAPCSSTALDVITQVASPPLSLSPSPPPTPHYRFILAFVLLLYLFILASVVSA